MNATYKQLVIDWTGRGLFIALTVTAIFCGLYFVWGMQ